MLDMILKKLHVGGHRVLIFAQMTRTLDILQVCHLSLCASSLYRAIGHILHDRAMFSTLKYLET